MSVVKADFVLSRPGFTMEIQCEIDQKVTAILGPSGAGKTTFIKVLAGLQTPDHGKVTIQGREVFDSANEINLPPEKRNIGYVFQEGRLFPHMNVAQNLKYGLKKRLDIKYFDQVTGLLKISDIVNKSISEISGGQAQRVAIGRALLSSPEILVLDEPFSSLDKNLRQHIISLLKPMVDEFDIPMLVISHDLSDLLMLSENLLILKDGKCMGYGNYYDLINKNEAMNVLNKSGLMNNIEMKINYADREKGLMILSHEGKEIIAESWHDERHYLNEKFINVFLRPEDITLASHQIKDISIQNQLEGKIDQLVVAENKVFVVIDHGFKLIAEVTLAAKQKMKLEKGAKIWSLFKAAAVKINTPGIVNSNEI